MGAFKTLGLRNAALTAPYMHDGSLETLDDVVRHYNRGGGQGSPIIRPLGLTESEIADLAAFLESLAGRGGWRRLRCRRGGTVACRGAA